MSEIFDVVNDKDEVIDQQQRDIVHERNLYHRAVHALVFDDQQRIYLQKRAMEKDTNPGLWDTSMGGHVEAGESYDQAAIRELEEELGIALVDVPEKLFKLPASEQTGFEFIWIYRVIHSGKITPCEVEISEARWIGLDELEYWMQQMPALFTSSLHVIMQHFKAMEQS